MTAPIREDTLIPETGVDLRSLVKRSKWSLIGYTILHSTWQRARFASGHIDSITAFQFGAVPVAEAVRRIERNYHDYFRYGHLSIEDIRNKVILEGGPGDSIGVPLLLLAAGAARVATIDKFKANVDPEHNRSIYQTLRESLPEQERRRFDSVVTLNSEMTADERYLKSIYGTGLEESDKVFEANSFDLIISRGVIQEIFDTDKVFASMDRVLRPGGKMIHKIDLRDYGLFSSNGHHPLEFLTIPDAVYSLMAKQSNRPSRKTVDYYRKKMAELGYEAGYYVTTITRPGYIKPPPELIPHQRTLERGRDYTEETLRLVHSIRPRLAKQFRHLSDEDLMTAGIFLVAKKPAA
jgi:SAM-dependent methyltransferase